MKKWYFAGCETEPLFDGKLCQEYLCQNYQNLIIGFQVTVENVGDTFLRNSVDLWS